MTLSPLKHVLVPFPITKLWDVTNDTKLFTEVGLVEQLKAYGVFLNKILSSRVDLVDVHIVHSFILQSSDVLSEARNCVVWFLASRFHVSSEVRLHAVW